MRQRPPRLTDWWLRRCLPPGARGRSIYGDIREEFAERQRRDGRWAAWWWFVGTATVVGTRYLAARMSDHGWAVWLLQRWRPRWATSHRDSRGKGDNMLQQVIRNSRIAVRGFRREPGFTAIVIVTLALGIGANAAIVSVFNAVLLQALPYPEAGRLVVMTDQVESKGSTLSTSWLNFRDWTEQQTVFDDMAVFNTNHTFTVTGGEGSERLQVNFSSPSYLPMIGAEPAVGRLFVASDNERPMGHPLAVLSHGLWQRRFGGDPDVVGRSIVLNGLAYTVIGVTQEGLHDVFAFGTPTDLWAPVMMLSQTDRADVFDNRRVRRLIVLARLKHGVSAAQAHVEMNAVADRMEEAYPEANAGMGVSVRPLRQVVVGNLRGRVVALWVGAGIVFLIGCLNAASLFLVRATTRARQFALQMALGATGRRLAMQVLTEALLLAGAGGLLGIVVVNWSLDSLLALSPVTLPDFVDVRMDLRVLAATTALTVIGGIAFGLGAAFRGARTGLRDGLGGSERTTAGRRDARTRHILVVAEVATAVVLLIGAGLMVRSLRALQHTETGFRTDHLLMARVDLPALTYPNHESIGNFGLGLAERLRSLPGVESADMWGPNQLLQPTIMQSVVRRDRAVRSSSEAEIGRYHFVTPGALERLGLRILRGRGIGEQDRNPHSPVIVISEGLARTLFGDEDPLGHYVRYYIVEGSPLDSVPWSEIVGVVSNAKNGGRVIGPGGFDTDHDMYFSLAERPRPELVMVVRTTGDPTQLADAVRAAVREADDDLAVYGVQTMDDILAQEEQTSRFTALLMAAFGAVALFLAALGIYGMLAYSVNRRTREIGLRSALGATDADNARLFVGQGMRLATLGVVLGLGGSFVVTRFVSKMLYGVRPTDAMTFIAAPLVLLLVSFAACYLPTRRASRVDPVEALRAD